MSQAFDELVEATEEAFDHAEDARKYGWAAFGFWVLSFVMLFTDREPAWLVAVLGAIIFVVWYNVIKIREAKASIKAKRLLHEQMPTKFLEYEIEIQMWLKAKADEVSVRMQDKKKNR